MSPFGSRSNSIDSNKSRSNSLVDVSIKVCKNNMWSENKKKESCRKRELSVTDKQVSISPSPERFLLKLGLKSYGKE